MSKRTTNSYDRAPLAVSASPDKSSSSEQLAPESDWQTLYFYPDTQESAENRTTEGSSVISPTYSPLDVISSTVRQSTVSSPSPVSDELYFKNAYPQQYISALEKWQKLVTDNSSLIKTPFSFTSEKNVLAFYEIFLDFLVSKKYISPTDASDAKFSLHTEYKAIKAKEREAMGRQASSLDPHEWMKQITAWILPEYTFAALWQTTPLCYKQSGTAGKGYVVPNPTCNGGITAAGVVVPDCLLPGSATYASCTVPLGCLNASCPITGNAIWDNKTKLCGCDTGVAGAIAGAGAGALSGFGAAAFSAVPAAFAQMNSTKEQAANPGNCPTAGATTGTLANQKVTSYFPGASEATEGKVETSRAGADGQYKPKTLEMFRNGASNFVTIASDPSMYGKSFIIPEITYAAYETDTNGNFVRDSSGNYSIAFHTLYNVPAYVHDTGSDFGGHPDKFDIATQILDKTMSGTRVGNAQPSFSEVIFKPAIGVGTNAAVCE